MRSLWAYLQVAVPVFLLCGLWGCICALLARRITKGSKFGRGMDALAGVAVSFLLAGLIGLIADILGVKEFPPFKMGPIKMGPIGLEMHFVFLTVSLVALVFLVKWLAKKERSISAGEQV